MAKGFPRKINVSFKVPANANYARVTIDVIPASEVWAISAVSCSAPANVTLADVSINGAAIGLYVEPSAFGEFRILDYYGEPLTVGSKQLSIVTVNSSAVEVTVPMTIYGFVQQAWQ
ncbi:hypothetical protein D3C71_448940 [compost metagenome]